MQHFCLPRRPEKPKGPAVFDLWSMPTKASGLEGEALEDDGYCHDNVYLYIIYAHVFLMYIYVCTSYNIYSCLIHIKIHFYPHTHEKS